MAFWLFSMPPLLYRKDTIELSCHGGRATTARVLQLTLHAGRVWRIRESLPSGPSQNDARSGAGGGDADVIRARTESARRLARRQLDGALSQAVGRLKDDLIGILAAIEVTIRF